MGLRCGFHRVFVVGTCLWFFYCLIVLPYQLRQNAVDHYSFRSLSRVADRLDVSRLSHLMMSSQFRFRMAQEPRPHGGSHRPLVVVRYPFLSISLCHNRLFRDSVQS
jgi:hypothetical protein